MGNRFIHSGIIYGATPLIVNRLNTYPYCRNMYASTMSSASPFQKLDSQTLKRPLSDNSTSKADSQSSRMKTNSFSSQFSNFTTPVSVTDVKALQKYLLNPQEKLPSWTLSEFIISALRSIPLDAFHICDALL